MRITFYGGAGEVGRSCMLLEGEHGKNIMLDCGIKLGEKTQYPLISDEDIRRVSNIFITHAHLDHSGYLPHLYATGASPNIFATKPTRDLAGILLADYQRIQTWRRKEAKIGREEIKKFRQKDVDAVLKNMNIIELGERVSSDFHFTTHNAGHILGSAMIRIEEKGGVLYTGDLSMRKSRILDGCEKNIAAEVLITENTYGAKKDVIPSLKESAQKMAASITKTINEGGHLLIPSFAVGRAQEILLMLDDYMRSGGLPKVKIFVEGMINKALSVYRHNAYYANDDIKKRILMSEDNPFKSPFFHVSRSKTREDVLKEPAIVVSTSGMLSGGPVLFYLEKLAANPKNKLIFVGYQAEGTLGRKLINGEKKIEINGAEIEVKMKVEEAHISGHADYNELLQFIKGVKNLKKVFLVHGERGELKESLEKGYEVITPKLGESHWI